MYYTVTHLYSWKIFSNITSNEHARCSTKQTRNNHCKQGIKNNTNFELEQATPLTCKIKSKLFGQAINMLSRKKLQNLYLNFYIKNIQ